MRIYGLSANSGRGADATDAAPLFGGHSILEGIAGQLRCIEFGLAGEGYHTLAAALADLSQGLQRADRSRRPKLLGELAAGGLLPILRRRNLALRSRPCALVFASPERPASMHEQDPQPTLRAPKCEDARAQLPLRLDAFAIMPRV